MFLRQALLRDYAAHLRDLKRELERWPKDSAEAKRLYDLIRHYEGCMRELEGVA